MRYSQDNSIAVARYKLAIDRRFKREGEPTADFIPCVAFGKAAEFAEKYLHQGTKIAVVGRIQTGSYTNNEGKKVYTTEVVVEEQEFAESKAASNSEPQENKVEQIPPKQTAQEWLNIPEGLEDSLPFN